MNELKRHGRQKGQIDEAYGKLGQNKSNQSLGSFQRVAFRPFGLQSPSRKDEVTGGSDRECGMKHSELQEKVAGLREILSKTLKKSGGREERVTERRDRTGDADRQDEEPAESEKQERAPLGPLPCGALEVPMPRLQSARGTRARRMYW